MNDINFNVGKKTIFGILCDENCESAALMETLAGIMTITEGEVNICGYNIATDRQKAQLLIGYMPQKMPFYENMSVMEYLSFIAEAKQLPYDEAQKNIKKALSTTGLLQIKNALICKLRVAGKARVGIAQAIVSNPSVLLLDDPTRDLNKNETAEIFSLIKMVSKSRTVIITSDNPEIFSLCDNTATLSLGQLELDVKESIGKGKNNGRNFQA